MEGLRSGLLAVFFSKVPSSFFGYEVSSDLTLAMSDSDGLAIVGTATVHASSSRELAAERDSSSSTLVDSIIVLVFSLKIRKARLLRAYPRKIHLSLREENLPRASL